MEPSRLTGYLVTMMKILLVLFSLCLALGVAAYLFLASRLDSLVVDGVNTYGPKVTQTKVELVAAKLSPLSGAGELTGLMVGNPAGWSDSRALYLGKVRVDVAPMSVFGDLIVINEIVIDQPEFTYETTFVSSNIKELLRNIEKFTGSEGGGKEGKSRKFIVKKFRLTNGKATVGTGGKALVVTLPSISLDDLGVAEGGITAGQLTGALVNKVLGGIVAGSAAALGSGDLSVDKLKATAKKAADELKKMFERK